MIRQICLAALFGTALFAPAVLVRAEEPRSERTTVAIDGTRWLINGRVTYPGSAAEGLLMNVRMVNATFEDRNRDDFDLRPGSPALAVGFQPFHVDTVGPRRRPNELPTNVAP